MSNMQSYQKFLQVYNMCKDDMEGDAVVDGLKMRLPVLKKKYMDLEGTDDEEYIMKKELSNARRTSRETMIYLEAAHVFELEDKYKFLLSLTKNPEKDMQELWGQVRLPFKEIFIDCEFGHDEFPEVNNRIGGFLIKELNNIEPVISKTTKRVETRILYGLKVYYYGTSAYQNKMGHYIDNVTIPFVDSNGNTDINVIYEDKKQIEFIKKFIINFILFLKNREVTYIHRTRDAKNREKRIKNKQIPLPSSKIIKLTGELKRYVDSIQDSSFKGAFSYKFWVSGHWRTLKSARYKQKKVMWIAPFIKGQGILVKKSYKIIPDEEADEFDFEDIK